MEKSKKHKTALGLDENIEAVLCYALAWVSGIIFLIIDHDNKFVRFHAAQSLLTFGLINVIMLTPFDGWMTSVFIPPLSFILWLFLMYKAYQGERFKLPIIGKLAEKQFRK